MHTEKMKAVDQLYEEVRCFSDDAKRGVIEHYYRVKKLNLPQVVFLAEVVPFEARKTFLEDCKSLVSPDRRYWFLSDAELSAV
jgi:hypothetical protein